MFPLLEATRERLRTSRTQVVMVDVCVGCAESGMLDRHGGAGERRQDQNGAEQATGSAAIQPLG